VGVGVSVGRRVEVSVDVKVDAGVKVSVGGKFVDVEAGVGEEEAGVCPGLLIPHAAMIKVKNIRRM